MVKILTDRKFNHTNHLFTNRPDEKIGCGLKTKVKKVGNVVKKGFKIAKKAQDLVRGIQKKAIKELGTNQTIRNVVEAIPFGDTINAVTKVASDVVNVTDKMKDAVSKKENPFKNEEIKSDVKNIVNEAKNNPNIKKLIDSSVDMIKTLFGKVDKSNLPQSEKEDIKNKADSLNLDLIKEAKTASSAGKIAKSLPYGMFVDRSSKKPKIPKKYQDMFGLPAKTLNNEGGRLFLNGSGRLGLGLSLSTPTPEGGKLTEKIVKKAEKPKVKKVEKQELYDMLFN